MPPADAADDNDHNMDTDRKSMGERYDVIISGASIAGCTAAILYARAGARVAVVERRADMDAYKVLCTHVIQPSAMPVLQRLDLEHALERAGAVQTTAHRYWTRWGWIEPTSDS